MSVDLTGGLPAAREFVFAHQPDDPLEQAIVRYPWDGETANRMMERSIPPEEMAPS